MHDQRFDTCDGWNSAKKKQSIIAGLRRSMLLDERDIAANAGVVRTDIPAVVLEITSNTINNVALVAFLESKGLAIEWVFGHCGQIGGNQFRKTFRC